MKIIKILKRLRRDFFPTTRESVAELIAEIKEASVSHGSNNGDK